MPLIVKIAEAEAIRRLAGALATSRAATARARNAPGLDFGQSVRVYFVRFPWLGQAVGGTAGALPEFKVATVGQYFSMLDWEGMGRLADDGDGDGDDAGSATAVIAAPAPPETSVSPAGAGVSLDGFFNNYFGDGE